MIIPVSVLLLISYLTRGTNGLYCLSCNDVPNPRDCRELKKCGSSEVCFDRQYVATSGRVTHDMGCMDKLQCQGAVTGKKRSNSKRDSLIICEQCCDTDFCQTTLCGSKDFVSPHGPICFSCHTLIRDDCNTFEICGRDQVCIENLKPSSGSGDVLMTSGCFGKEACEAYKSVFVGKRSAVRRNTCFNCCDGDLCNSNCSVPAVSTIATTTHTPAIVTTAPIVSTTPHCIDQTSAEVCKVAASLVCKDRDKALNANCMHYCNFC